MSKSLLKFEHIQHFPVGKGGLKMLCVKSGKIVETTGFYKVGCYKEEEEDLIIKTKDCSYFNSIWNLKPILRTTSMLMDEITNLGENFTPLFHLREIYPHIDIFIASNGELDIFAKNGDSLKQKDFLGIITLLREWKFDLDGLIKKGLAVSVSDDLNPYIQ